MLEVSHVYDLNAVDLQIISWKCHVKRPFRTGVIKQIVNLINWTDGVFTGLGSRASDLGAST